MAVLALVLFYLGLLPTVMMVIFSLFVVVSKEVRDAPVGPKQFANLAILISTSALLLASAAVAHFLGK